MTRSPLLVALLALCVASSCKKEKNTTPPKYTFSYSGMLLPNSDIQFTSSAPAGSKHVWLFGDGGSSTEAAPVHVYATNNEYKVKLVIDGGDTVRNSLFVCDDPGHTSEAVGARAWRHYYISGSATSILRDTSFALVYVNALTICYGRDTMYYVPGSNTGETIAFKRTYNIPGMLNQSYDLLFNYLGNQAVLVRTIPTSIYTHDVERFVTF